MIDKGRKNERLLIQPQYRPMLVEEEVAVIYCGVKGLLQNVPMDKVAEVIQKQVNTPAQADKAISQVVELNISNEKKAEVVRTIIENVEVSAEADTHVQNMSAAVQNEDSVATVSAETASVGNETAGADMSADVTVDGTDVQE